MLCLNLTSPDYVGNQTVQIITKIGENIIGKWNGFVHLNETYGSLSLLSFSAVRKQVKLPVDSTGPLELTFFLNYELPESGSLQNGTVSVIISPQIVQPDPDINGVLKCYFKGSYQAANCTFDNSNPLKTTITLISPP